MRGQAPRPDLALPLASPGGRKAGSRPGFSLRGPPSPPNDSDNSAHGASACRAGKHLEAQGWRVAGTERRPVLPPGRWPPPCPVTQTPAPPLPRKFTRSHAARVPPPTENDVPLLRRVRYRPHHGAVLPVPARRGQITVTSAGTRHPGNAFGRESKASGRTARPGPPHVAARRRGPARGGRHGRVWLNRLCVLRPHLSEPRAGQLWGSRPLTHQKCPARVPVASGDLECGPRSRWRPRRGGVRGLGPRKGAGAGRVWVGGSPRGPSETARALGPTRSLFQSGVTVTACLGFLQGRPDSNVLCRLCPA